MLWTKTDFKHPTLWVLTLTITIKMANKQINDAIYAIIETLADNYGFDADEALDYISTGTDTNHVESLLKLFAKKETKKKEDTKTEVKVEVSDEVKKVQHNITLWEKKLEAGDYKDKEAHVKKIEAEKKKLAKLQGTTVVAKVEAAPVVVAKPEVAEKRIKRFSPAMATQLGTALEKVKLSLTDKLKKEFAAYIEELDVDTFRGASLADHMRTFSESKVPHAGGGAGSKKPEEDEEPPHLEAKTPEAEPVVTLTREELAKLKMVVATEKPEVLWDPTAKRHVKGPARDDDEDVNVVKFKGKEYVVGDKTGRVYEVKDEGDVFMGFKGVGLFKTMS